MITEVKTPLVPVSAGWAQRKLWAVTQKAKEFSPEILLGIGVIGVITAGVMGAKAYKDHEYVMNESLRDLRQVRNVPDDRIEADTSYTQKDHTIGLAKAYGQVALAGAKHYGPTIAIASFSIYSLVASHGVMRTRNASVLAAYKLVEEAFKKYRARVVEDLGLDADERYRYGHDQRTITTVVPGKDGKRAKKLKTKQNMISEEFTPDMYERIFGEGNPEWVNDPEVNLMVLRAHEAHANELLHAKGILLLNDVYNMLRIAPTTAGAVVGWRVTDEDDDQHGDNYVSFGLDTDGHIDMGGNQFLICPNVDGVVFRHLG